MLINGTRVVVRGWRCTELLIDQCTFEKSVVSRDFSWWHCICLMSIADGCQILIILIGFLFIVIYPSRSSGLVNEDLALD